MYTLNQHSSQFGTFYLQSQQQQLPTSHGTPHLDIADGVALLVDVLTVGDHQLDLSTLKEVELQQVWDVLAELDGVQHTQQFPAHWEP